MNKKAMIGLGITLLVLVPLVSAHHLTQETGDKCGVAVFGEGVNAVYDIVAGQSIPTAIIIKNTGTIEENITLESSVSLGFENSVEVQLDITSCILKEGESKEISFDITLLNNESEVVCVDIQVSAEALEQPEGQQIINAGAISHTYLQVSNDICFLKVSVMDQNNLPFARVEVSMFKDTLLYAEGITNNHGEIVFVVAKGNYSFVIKGERELFVQSAYSNQEFIDGDIIEVLTDCDIVLVVRREVHYEENTFITLNMVEWLFFIALGYSIRLAEDKYKKRGSKNESNE